MARVLTSSSRIPTDAWSGGIVQIDISHAQLHEGLSFSAMFSRTTAATNGHRSGLYVKTPASPTAHLVASFATSAAANLTICEAPTIASNIGTHTGTILNRNRNSALTSGLLNNATTPAANKFTTLDET